MDLNKLEQNVDRARLISIVRVVAGGFGYLLMFLIGAVEIFRANSSYFTGDLFAPGRVAMPFR